MKLNHMVLATLTTILLNTAYAGGGGGSSRPTPSPKRDAVSCLMFVSYTTFDNVLQQDKVRFEDLCFYQNPIEDTAQINKCLKEYRKGKAVDNATSITYSLAERLTLEDLSRGPVQTTLEINAFEAQGLEDKLTLSLEAQADTLILNVGEEFNGKSVTKKGNIHGVLGADLDLKDQNGKGISFQSSTIEKAWDGRYSGKVTGLSVTCFGIDK